MQKLIKLLEDLLFVFLKTLQKSHRLIVMRIFLSCFRNEKGKKSCEYLKGMNAPWKRVIKMEKIYLTVSDIFIVLCRLVIVWCCVISHEKNNVKYRYHTIFFVIRRDPDWLRVKKCMSPKIPRSFVFRILATHYW